MDELKERTETQLSVIEMLYSIKIQNKEEIVSLLSERLNDKKQILMVCTSISSWIAGSSIKGDAVIPINVILRFIDAVS